MGEELADGDGFFSVAGESGEQAGDGAVEVEPVGFDEAQDGGGGCEDFGERGDIEEGIDRHSFRLREEGAMAESPGVDAPVGLEMEDGAGKVSSGDGVFDGAVEFPQFGQVEGVGHGG